MQHKHDVSNIYLVGIDLAKNVFQIHAVNRSGRAVAKRRLRRSQVLEYFRKLPRCVVAMEACGGSHYWGRQFARMGHEVRIMPAAYVKPYVKTHKNDAHDAAAIAEAAQRPDMRFVAIKSEQQQACQMEHKRRESLIKRRTQVVNAIRSFCAEYGFVMAKGRHHVMGLRETILDPDDRIVPEVVQPVLQDMYAELDHIEEQLARVEQRLREFYLKHEACQLLTTIPGIGELTATALVSMLGDLSQFRNARHLSAFLGLVPRQFSSGNQQVLGGISKHGNQYLRKLLIHGARSLCRQDVKSKPDYPAAFRRLVANKPTSVAAVGIANRNARIVWAVLTRWQPYQPDYVAPERGPVTLAA